MFTNNQNIKGLEAAYRTVYNRELSDRVQELVNQYGDSISRLDSVCCEIQPNGAVPCFYKLSELGSYYKIKVTS